MTIIITTSPIRSNPSIELLTSINATFFYAGSNFLACPRIIVCDGYRDRQSNDNPGKTEGKKGKYSGEKAAMRSGYVNDEQKENYVEFKRRVREGCMRGDEGFTNATMLEMGERVGYGFALKAALQEVKTKYVCVIQHDRCFMRKTPMDEVVAAMERDEGIKYVGILMRSNLHYIETFHGKYGQKIMVEAQSLSRRPPELMLPVSDYGTSLVAEKLCELYPRCAVKYRQLRSNYVESVTYKKYYLPPPTTMLPAGLATQASLIPTAFWYDNVHVARTEHYRDFIFDKERKYVAKGGFVEDKLSPAIMKDIKQDGVEAGWGKFGSFLLDDHAGVAFTGHLDGGSFMTEEEREGSRHTWEEKNRAIAEAKRVREGKTGEGGVNVLEEGDGGGLGELTIED